MERVLTFTDGMYEASNDLFLDDKKALSISNLIFNGSNFENIKDLVEKDILFEDADMVYKWQSANKIAASVSNQNYVVIVGGILKVAYLTGSGSYAYHATTEAVISSSFFYADSPEQFVFVDGIGGDYAKRITIDDIGTLSISRIGVEAPLNIADFNEISTISVESDSIGTGMPSGVIVQYIHTDVNEYGEESNPSPILSLSNSIGLVRGEKTDSKIDFSPVLGGEVVKVELEAELKAGVSKKRLYRRWVGYAESPLPFSKFLLVNDYEFSKGTVDRTVVLIDSFESSPIEANYDRDMGSPADDVIIFDNTIVLGNANKSKDFFPIEVDKAWELRLNNNNSSNFVDAVVRIAIFDESFSSVLNKDEYCDADLSAVTKSNLCFVFGDRITPLASLMYKDTTFDTFSVASGKESFSISLAFDIKIPYMIARQSNVIYLCYNETGFTGTAWEGFNRNFNELQSASNKYFLNSFDNNDIYEAKRVKGESNYILYRCTEYSNMKGLSVSDNNANKLMTPSAGTVVGNTATPNSMSLFHPYSTDRNSFWLYNTGFIYGQDRSLAWYAADNNLVITDNLNFSSFFEFDKMSSLGSTDQKIFILGNASTTEESLAGYMRLTVGNEVYFKIAGQDLLLVSSYDSNNKYGFYVNVTISNTGENDTYIDVQFMIAETDSSNDTVFSYKQIRFLKTDFHFEDENLYLVLERWAGGDDGSTTVEMTWSQPSIEFDTFSDSSSDPLSVQRFLASASLLPGYKTSAIGLYYSTDTFEYDTKHYERNANIFFKEVNLTETVNKDGYITFGSEYISDLNEINLNEKILRLAKLPSFTSDQDVNTVLAFCENNIYRVYLDKVNAQYTLASELQSVSLLSKRAMAITDRNVYFLTDKGIIQYGKDGISNISKFKVLDASGFTNFFYSAKDRILKCYNSTSQLWYQIDYDTFSYADYACTFVGSFHNKSNFYLNNDKLYEHGTTNKTGHIITGKINAKNKLMTLYSTKDLSVEIDLFSAKLGTVMSMPVYILYLDDNDKKIYLGNRLSGSIIDAKTVYLEEFLKYHPANIKCDFVALQILVEDGFEILSVGLGGK